MHSSFTSPCLRGEHRPPAAAVLALSSWRYGVDWMRSFGPLTENAGEQSSYALPHRLEHSLRARTFPDHTPQTAFDQQWRVRVHPRSRRRSRRAQSVAWARRSRAGEVNDVALGIDALTRFVELVAERDPPQDEGES